MSNFHAALSLALVKLAEEDSEKSEAKATAADKPKADKKKNLGSWESEAVSKTTAHKSLLRSTNASLAAKRPDKDGVKYLHDALLKAITKHIGVPIGRGFVNTNATLANSGALGRGAEKATYLVHPLAQVATDIGLSFNKDKANENSATARYAEQIRPYQDKLDMTHTTPMRNQTTWLLNRAGVMSGADSLIAHHRFMRNKHPVQYWANPFQASGPLTEVAHRLMRRSIAGNAVPESTLGRAAMSTIPLANVIAGGRDAQNNLRRLAVEHDMYDPSARPDVVGTPEESEDSDIPKTACLHKAAASIGFVLRG